MGELSITNWFEYDPNVSDLDNVFRFVESLPQKFELLFSADTLHLDEIIKRANVPSITSELIYEALQESKIA